MNEKSEAFIDFTQNTCMEAVFDEGKLIDSETLEILPIKNGTRVVVLVPMHALDNNFQKKLSELERKKMLDNSVVLHFSFLDDSGSRREFLVTLLEDLYISRKGRGLGKLDDCKCSVREENSKNELFKVDSLNQAYFQASMKFRQKNKSHTCNVFRTFRFNKQVLGRIREQALNT
jgi:hypothetical protein